MIYASMAKIGSSTKIKYKAGMSCFELYHKTTGQSVKMERTMTIVSHSSVFLIFILSGAENTANLERRGMQKANPAFGLARHTSFLRFLYAKFTSNPID